MLYSSSFSRFDTPRLLWLITIVAFYSLLIRFGQNIPTADDFQASLNFVYAFVYTGKNASEQWLLLFSQHNEHRILSSRLLALALYGSTGQVNLLALLCLQQLFWLAFVAMIVRLGQSINLWRSAWLGLPVILLLFHPNTFDTLLNVWGGSQTYPTLLFTLVALCALQRSTVQLRANSWLAVAIVAAGLATFSFGSGFLVWLGGAVYLFLSRRYASLSAWLVIATFMVGLYLWNYEPPVSGTLAVVPVSDRLIATAKFLCLFPAASFMAIWPSLPSTLPNLILCYIIGLGSWLYAGRLLLTGYGSRNPLFFSILVVSLATGFLLAFGRGAQGTTGALTSRYQIFANMIPLTLYLIWVDKSAKPQWVSYASGALLLFVQVLLIWSLWSVLDKQYIEKKAGLAQWVQHRAPVLSIQVDQQRAASERLEHCLQKRIFILPPDLKWK